MVRSWEVGGKKSPHKVAARKSRLSLDQLEDRALMDAGFRAIDGSGNNLAHPTWGSTGVDLIRKAPAAYADGVSDPAGANRPSARVISSMSTWLTRLDLPEPETPVTDVRAPSGKSTSMPRRL